MLLSLIVESRGPHVLVRAVGELDMSTADNLSTAATEALQAGDDLFLLDLSGVTFLDSTGLSAVLAVHRAATARDVYAAVVAPSPSVLHVLKLLGLESVLHVHDSIEDALRRTGPDT